MMKQPGFSDLEYTNKKKTTRRERFLQEMDSIPDENTILRFRHRLEKEGLTSKLFQKLEGYLSEHGLIVNEGTIVDATIIGASW